MRKKARTIYATEEVWERCKEHAERCGRSISSYICALALLEVPKPVPPEEFHLLCQKFIRVETMLCDKELKGEETEEITCELKAIRKSLERIILPEKRPWPM